MKKKLIIGVAALATVFIIYFIVKGGDDDTLTSILTTPKRGHFKIEIETTGELEAKNSVKILGPSTLREFGIFQVNIQNIIDEGTIVKKGDWVATLDRSDFQNKYSQKQIEVEKANSKFVQTQLDTTLQMRQSRDELINLKYTVEEKKIIQEQSKFEPPATIKQAGIDYDKAKRGFEQAQENYKIKKRQNIEKMREISAELRKVQNDFTNMTRVLESFNVVAPEDGMLIYEKGWDGKPIKAGSQVSVWEPTVATLPDLTKMMSKTYVNEVDVRKIKAGQRVDIGLDAYPDKKLSGTVIRVANVGEQRPNSDAKVFEVAVEIAGTDATLRPSMTTSNKIIAQVIDNALYIPLECLHNLADTVTYVYKKEGLKVIKQEIIVGEANANDVVVRGGLTDQEQLYLSIPSGQEDGPIALLKELNGKRKKKKDVEENKVEAKPTAIVIPTKSY
ncbi:MAG TPA: HlyD family efflux transporter periplasmic adaptor subunit [Cyclobacteriaceae bacterium]